MAKAPNVFPIIGGRKVEHLKGNIAALNLRLTRADIKEIEGANKFEVGFPLDFLKGEGVIPGVTGGAEGPADMWLHNPMGTFDYVDEPVAIGYGVPKEVEEVVALTADNIGK
jgi:hypothetical protein